MTISTHVLNATTGQPAAGLELALSQQDGPGWRELSRRATGPDGRVSDLAGQVAPGVYRIVFQTGAYLPETFYPEVSVAFRVTDPAAHHHVPLLLSPYAYSTYRGS
ncbi:MAG TPA: hydroxyisourate hydrolase [Streptosporangiaceae bacterium]|nr:hydroxyisourate hydrolase [Streptosporangiaceae bacterium]